MHRTSLIINLSKKIALRKPNRLIWETFYFTMAVALIAIFSFVAYINMADYADAERKMGDQAFSDRWVPYLTAVNLIAQIAIALLLFVGLFSKTVLTCGFGFATMLLAVYTAYSELATFKFLGRAPCSCIGWLENQDWKGVFTINLILLLFSLMAFIITFKERRVWKKMPKKQHP